jgi:hypothetical protein
MRDVGAWLLLRQCFSAGSDEPSAKFEIGLPIVGERASALGTRGRIVKEVVVRNFNDAARRTGRVATRLRICVICVICGPDLKQI